MSIQTSQVDELSRELGEAIANLPEYEAFESAKEAVQNSEEAQERIDEFERVRQEFMLARQSGTASQDDLEKLQETQDELHEMPIMEEYLRTKSDLEARLDAINTQISDPLVLNFGEEAGGCCQD